MPGLKKAVGAELNPAGKHDAVWSSMCRMSMLSTCISEHIGSRAVKVVVRGMVGKEVIVKGV